MFYITNYVRIIMNQTKTQNDSVYLMWTCSESKIRLAKMHMHKTLIFYLHHLVLLKIYKYILWTQCSSAQNETNLLQVQCPTKISFYLLWEHLLHHSLSLTDIFFYFVILYLIKLFSTVFSQQLTALQNFPIICEFCPYLLHVPGHA